MNALASSSYAPPSRASITPPPHLFLAMRALASSYAPPSRASISMSMSIHSERDWFWSVITV